MAIAVSQGGDFLFGQVGDSGGGNLFFCHNRFKYTLSMTRSNSQMIKILPFNDKNITTELRNIQDDSDCGNYTGGCSNGVPSSHGGVSDSAPPVESS